MGDILINLFRSSTTSNRAGAGYKPQLLEKEQSSCSIINNEKTEGSENTFMVNS
jgi:hypothetical protein